MNILDGLKNFLQFINNNWTLIVIIIGLIIGIVEKIKSYIKLSKEEKIELARKQLKEIMLSLVSRAELEWDDYKNAGSIKRSQVFEDIYEQYPILKEVANQEDMIHWIDNLIDTTLLEMKNVIEDM